MSQRGTTGSIGHVVALGAIMQVAYALLADKVRRERLQAKAPVTCFALVIVATTAAALSAVPYCRGRARQAADFASRTRTQRSRLHRPCALAPPRQARLWHD